MADDLSMNPSRDDFAALLAETIGETGDFAEGTVVKGLVAAIEKDIAIIDVGLKTEGRIAVKEFGVDDAGKATLKVGDTVEVFLERIENALGEAVISRDKARREEAWTRLEAVFAKNEPVMGAIIGRVKGGFTVDLGGASAFLPGSQVDIRPVRDVGPLMGREQPFAILKMDRPRGNIVVSRRAILEEARAEQRTELVSQLLEGEVREGVVKNITDYGAFVDLGGIDGLLHVTDMSWKRVSHPSQVLAVGDTIKVQIIKINPETQRISLGMKQLQSDPWDGVEAKYPAGAKFTGRITNITDYGAFVELEAGVEGLVHVSEMSWTKKNVHPGKIVSTSQEVEVVVLDVDASKRRVSLGLRGSSSWNGTRWAPRSRARSRTPPSSACSSAWMATSTAWCTCRTSTGTRRAKRPWPATRRAKRSRPACSMSMSRRSVSASASSSCPAIPWLATSTARDRWSPLRSPR